MPVWSQEELLECPQAVLSCASCTDVAKALDVVGGVARAVKHRTAWRRKELLRHVIDVDVGLLGTAASLQLGGIPTDDNGGGGLNIFPGIP